MDKLIKAVAKALSIKSMTIDDIHSAIIAKGWSEEDAYLAIKAGELLYKTIEEAEAEKAKRSLIRRST